jgi:cyclophilin family peptidyl-prolyl cis-trans isomerase
VALGGGTFAFSTTPAASSPTPARAAVQPRTPTALPETRPGVTPAASTQPAARRTYSQPPAMAINPSRTYVATIDTSKGAIVLDLYPAEAPIATNNFVFLAREGFYDGLTFHRVEDWVVQGGDPVGDGTGGPGYTIKDDPVNLNYTPGTLAMAKTSAPDSAGSQFFIMKRAQPLPKTYPIFGQVIQGLDIVNRLQRGDAIRKVTIQEN